MRKSLIFFIAAGAGAATFAAGSVASQDRWAKAEADYQKQIAGKVAGKPVDCIETRFNRPTLSAYRDKLIYRVSRNLVYVNKTTGGCEMVERDAVLVTRQYQTRLCRGDIAQTVDRQTGIGNGGCGLGSFTPYTPPR